jgi:hypothetical protein
LLFFPKRILINHFPSDPENEYETRSWIKRRGKAVISECKSVLEIRGIQVFCVDIHREVCPDSEIEESVNRGQIADADAVLRKKPA